MADDKRFCTFAVADLLLGVEATRVHEVFAARGTTRVPLAPPVVRGLINLRGRILPALDLRGPLGRPAPAADPPLNVLVGVGDGAVSLLADEVGEVLTVADAALEPPPETLAGAARRLIRAACPLDGRILLVLDVEAAVRLAEEGPPDAPVSDLPR